MKNHYHLCLRTPKGNLSRVMRHIDGLYTQRFNRSHKRDRALFKGRYKAILVNEDEYLAQVVRYIHLNPVSVGTVKQPEEYRWSSHAKYLQAKGAPQWLNTEEVLEPLGGRMGFHEFVLSGNEEALEAFYESKRHTPMLGGVEFVQSVRGREANLSREISQYKRRGVQPSPELVIGKLAGIYKLPKEEVLRGVRGKENEARKVAMYLVRQCCDQTLKQTAVLFGVESYGAVGWSCHGVKTKMGREKRFRDRIERIATEIRSTKI